MSASPERTSGNRVLSSLLGAASALYGVGWEVRRRLYARGTLRPERVDARVVSIGNLTVGGTGKTTLTLYLARRLASAARPFGVVCRRYRPGPGGSGDEELLYLDALGRECVYAGTRKLALARRAARDGRRVILVDDGFSHWRLARDVNLVTMDARDPWGGGRLLPVGRLREPHRALQRADAVILTRVDRGDVPTRALAEVGRYAPAALLAAGRHRVTGVRSLGAEPAPAADARVWIVTATGNPGAVERSAAEAGLEVAGCSRYRDHHWFRDHEVNREIARACAARARVLVTSKDAVRWPRQASAGVVVLDVEWEWVTGGAAIERMVESVT